LVFEEGPTEDIELQWATYRDASDQCSLSRIWGGIHPPIDDIKGRIIGHKLGIESYDLALDYFNGTLSIITPAENISATKLYPNPFSNTLNISSNYNGELISTIYSVDGKKVYQQDINKQTNTVSIDTKSLPAGFYFVKLINKNNVVVTIKKVIKN
jgi:hypothetical protein